MTTQSPRSTRLRDSVTRTPSFALVVALFVTSCAASNPRLQAEDELKACGSRQTDCRDLLNKCEQVSTYDECNIAYFAGSSSVADPADVARPFVDCQSNEECVVAESDGGVLVNRRHLQEYERELREKLKAAKAVRAPIEPERPTEGDSEPARTVLEMNSKGELVPMPPKRTVIQGPFELLDCPHRDPGPPVCRHHVCTWAHPTICM